MSAFVFSSLGASSVRLISWSHLHLSGRFLNFFLLKRWVNGQMYSGKSSGFVLSGFFPILPLSCSCLSSVSMSLVCLELNHISLCVIVQFPEHLINLMVPFFQLTSRLCLTNQSCPKNISVPSRSIMAASRDSLCPLITTSRSAILVTSQFFVPSALITLKEKSIFFV